MLQLLAARECDFDPPWLLPRVYQHQRYTQIQLSGQHEFARVHRGAVTSIDVDKEGRYVLSGGMDTNGHISIHDISSNVSDHKYPVVTKTLLSSTCSSSSSSSSSSFHPPPQPISHAVSVVQWYPHDTGLFTTSSVDHTLLVWDTNRMEVVEKYTFPKIVYTHSMATSDSHSFIAVGGGDHKVTLFDMVSGSSTHVLRFHSKSVLALSWSPISGHILASAGEDGVVLLWDVRMAKGPLLSLDQHNGGTGSSNTIDVSAHNGHVNGLTFTTDGLYLVSFGSDNAIRLWDSFSGKNTLINYGRIANTLAKRTLQFGTTPHTSSLQPLAVVPSGGELVMVELMTGRKVKRMCGHYGNVNCVVGHPMEQEFFSGGGDRNILIWAPPLSSGVESSERHATPHSRTMGVYEDAWSSDED